jgi:hypothetical protein
MACGPPKGAPCAAFGLITFPNLFTGRPKALNDGTLSGSVAIVAVGVVAGSLLAAIALAITVLIAPTIAAALRCEASAGVSFFGLYAAIESFPVVMNTLPFVVEL